MRGGLPEGASEARGSTVVARSSATRAATDSGRRGRPVTSLGSTPSSVRKRRLVTVVGGSLDRGDDEAFTRAGGGHVEQPPLLGRSAPGVSGSASPSRPMRSASRGSRGGADRATVLPGRPPRPPGATPGPWRCAVIRRTASGRTARRVRVSAAMSSASSSSGKLRAPRPRCAPRRGPRSRTARTRRRGRGRRCGRPRRRAGRPAPGRLGHGVPSHSSRAPPRPCRRRRGACGPRSSSPSRWAPRAYAGSCATRRSGSASARASSSSEGGGRVLSAARSSSRRARPRRRRSAVSMPARGGEQGQRGLGVEPGPAAVLVGLCGPPARSAMVLGDRAAGLPGSARATARSAVSRGAAGSWRRGGRRRRCRGGRRPR